MTVLNRVYDTRYFWEIYTTRDPERLGRLKSLLVEKSHRFVSSITLYEIYKLSLRNDGDDVAKLRCSLLKNDMRILSVDNRIAEEAARISHSDRVPMADAIIIATAKSIGAECITDDPHFDAVRDIKTRWL